MKLENIEKLIKKEITLTQFFWNIIPHNHNWVLEPMDKQCEIPDYYYCSKCSSMKYETTECWKNLRKSQRKNMIKNMQKYYDKKKNNKYVIRCKDDNHVWILEPMDKQCEIPDHYYCRNCKATKFETTECWKELQKELKGIK